MKKIFYIFLFALLIFTIYAYTLNNREDSVLNQDSNLFIGGRLPVEKENNTAKNDIIGLINIEEYEINYTEPLTKDIKLNNEKEITANKEITNETINETSSTTAVLQKNDINNARAKVQIANKVCLIDKIIEHEVKRGESLWTIARKYDIDIDTLIGANDISNMNMIQKGDILKILPVKGILYRINPGENLWEISQNFNIITDTIIKANNISNPNSVRPGDILLLPGAKPEFGYKERMSSKLMMPVSARISSYYGMRWGKMHEGIDFAVNTGTKIKASAAGKVIYSGWARGYGYTVIIEHQRGVRTLYAHNSKLLAHSGQYVNKGQVVCLSGNTGNSTGPHLHFEVQINGRPVNPLSYIK